MKTAIGARINSPDPAAGTMLPALKRIYGTLSDDLRATVKQFGGPRALTQFDEAERAAKAIVDKRKQLRAIIGRDINTKSGESVVDALVRKAGTTSTADLSALEKARTVIGDRDWGSVAGEAIARLGRDGSDAFNPTIFRRKYSALSDEGKALLFAPEMRQTLDDIARLGDVFARAAKQGNPSGSGKMMVSGSILAAPTIFSSGINPMVAIANIGGAAALSKFWSKPASVKTMGDYARAALAHAKSPSQTTQRAMTQAAIAAERELAEAMDIDAAELRERINASKAGRDRLTSALSGSAPRQNPGRLAAALGGQ